jgi:hypothetical protein
LGQPAGVCAATPRTVGLDERLRPAVRQRARQARQSGTDAAVRAFETLQLRTDLRLVELVWMPPEDQVERGSQTVHRITVVRSLGNDRLERSLPLPVSLRAGVILPPVETGPFLAEQMARRTVPAGVRAARRDRTLIAEPAGVRRARRGAAVTGDRPAHVASSQRGSPKRAFECKCGRGLRHVADGSAPGCGQ